MILDQLFTQPLFEDIADPNRLIVSVTIQPMSTGGEPIKKEIDLTGQFQGNTRSQMEQAMDYLTKMLESKGLNFTTLQARYQGSIMNQNNQGTMAPQSDWEREAEAKAAQMRAQARAQRPVQNATPAIKEGAADPITQFASNAHEEWRRNFDPTGTKPRIKKNSDGTEGDINVPFSDLHPDWQKENLAAGRAAQHAVKHFGNNMEKAAEFIHRQWMKRNPKADYNAAQHVPYDDLSDDEKEKDRVHVRTMMRLMGHHPEQGVAEVAPPGAKAERMVKHIKQGYAKDGKLTPKEKGIAFATAWKAHNAGQVEEGEITKNATGLKHRATDKYGAGDDEPHHYTGGRSGFSEPGKYARDLEHVNKQLVKDLDASMGISWKNRGPKGIEVDEQGVSEGVAETVSMDQAKKVLRHYGADHFKTTTNELHFYKNGRPMSVDLIFNDDATRSVSLRQMNSATRKLKGQGITEMDKSEPSAGRDTGPRPGPDREAKPISAKKATKDAADMLTRAVKDSHKKKDVKESDSLPQWKKDWYAKQKPNSWPKHPQPYHKPGWTKDLTPSELETLRGKKSNKQIQDIDENNDPLMMKLRRAMVQEGRVKELADDLKTMPDSDFMKKYGKAKAAIRKDMKRVDEAAQTNYTPQEMADILSGKKTQQQVDAERAKKIDDQTDDLVMRVDKQGRRVDKNGKLLPPPKTWTNPPINPPPGKMQQYEGLNEQDAAGQQFVGTGTSSNWQMSVDIAARNARIKAAQSIAGTNNIPNGVLLPPGTKYGPQDTKSDGTGKYVSTYTITLPAPSQSAEPAPAAPANNYLDSSPATSGATGSMSTGAPAAVGPTTGNYMKVNELSTNKLSQYKTAAAKDAKKADQAGDFKRGDKRLGGMVQATKKQFDNDAKKVDESRAARRALMARIVNAR